VGQELGLLDLRLRERAASLHHLFRNRAQLTKRGVRLVGSE
jgi:hypothetical protein